MIARKSLILLLMAAALGLTACGRKAPLDTPYDAGIAARKQAEDEGKPLPPAPKKPVKDRPFILDRLI